MKYSKFIPSVLIKDALSDVEGVLNPEVNLSEKYVVIETDNEISDKAIIDAIEGRIQCI